MANHITMSNRRILKNASIVTDGQIKIQDLLIEDELISKLGNDLSHPTAEVIDMSGNYLIPGVIDDQVHFREPGLTHKGNIATESRPHSLAE